MLNSYLTFLWIRFLLEMFRGKANRRIYQIFLSSCWGRTMIPNPHCFTGSWTAVADELRMVIRSRVNSFIECCRDLNCISLQPSHAAKSNLWQFILVLSWLSASYIRHLCSKKDGDHAAVSSRVAENRNAEGKKMQIHHLDLPCAFVSHHSWNLQDWTIDL